MCQVMQLYYAHCNHTIRYRLISRCEYGFCLASTSCKANVNEIIVSVPFYKPRWCDDCYDRRIEAVRDVYNIYVGDIYAQGEREAWGEERIEDAVRRCGEQERKELEMFSRCVDEAEERDERRFGRARFDEGGEAESRALEEVSDDEHEGPCQQTGEDVDGLPDDSNESEEDCSSGGIGECGFRIRGMAARRASFAQNSWTLIE